MDNIQSIRNQFRTRKLIGLTREGTLEIQGAQFECDDDRIFGVPNQKYIKAELEWYKSQSLNVRDLEKLYGRQVAIWRKVCDEEGYINSNYGWCIFSEANGNQYSRVLETLRRFPTSRQAVMIYIRPSMHEDATENGMHDFMCTTHVQYFINDDKLDAHVFMRSNDAIYGFNNDFPWQRYVQKKLAHDLRIDPGRIIWNAGSLHVYEEHWDLIDG